MTIAPPEKRSVLQTLAAEVMETKKAASRSLTPIPGEVPVPILPRTPAPFPNDIPQEVVEQKAAELTRIIEHLTEARDALLVLVARPLPANVVDLDAIKAGKEAAADARVEAAVAEDAPHLSDEFKASFAAKQAEAQAAVFHDVDAWHCSTHMKQGIEKTSETTGRTYIGCPDCNSFKR